jgi:hypothetical protein
MKKAALLAELRAQAAKTEAGSIGPGDVFNNEAAVLTYLSEYTDSTLKALNVSKLKLGVSISGSFDVSAFEISATDIKSILTKMHSAGTVQDMEAIFDATVTDDQLGTYTTLVAQLAADGWTISGLTILEPAAGFVLDQSKLNEGVLV